MLHKQLIQNSNVVSTKEDFKNLIGKTKTEYWKMFNFVLGSA